MDHLEMMALDCLSIWSDLAGPTSFLPNKSAVSYILFRYFLYTYEFTCRFKYTYE